MKEKTLRYPGHVELMRAFRETGLFSKEPVDVAGKSIRPLDATAVLLFPKWEFAEGEADLTVMRVMVEGRRGEERVRHTWDLLDRYDPKTGLRSMSRTTAFPATIVAGLLARGDFDSPGVNFPERIGERHGLLDRVLLELDARGVKVRHHEDRKRESVA